MTEEEAVTLIMLVARAETRKLFNVDSCIATTRIAAEVFRYFGYTSEPVPLTLMVFNAKAFAMMRENVPIKEWPDDAWSLGIAGSGVSEGKRWDGHLVVRVNDRWLVDGSLDQASRPERNMVVEPSVINAEGWDWKESNVWISGEGEGGVALIYEAMPRPGPWRNSPDWKDRKAEVRTAVASAIRTLKPLLDAAA